MNPLNRRIYSWVQLAARGPHGEDIRGNFVQLGNKKAVVDWCRQFPDRGAAHTICVFAEATHRARYVAPLYFHVRSEHGIEAARRGVLETYESVCCTLDCRPDSPQFYFDGEGGFDLVVPFETFDAFYSPYMFTLYAQLAAVMDSSKEYAVDRHIYSRDHLWQLPGSRCTEQGLYKVHLGSEEQMKLSCEEILAIAASPQSEEPCHPEGPDKFPPWRYKRAIQEVARKARACPKCRTITYSHSHVPAPCVQALASTELPDGTRHATYRTLASYFAYLNMHYPEIVARLQEIDCRNPIRDPQDIGAAAQFGCRHPSAPPCNSALRRYCPKEGCELADPKQLPAG
jgi:hypothetical protein